MIKNCSSVGYFYNSETGSALDETENIVPSSTRSILSSFSFTAAPSPQQEYWKGTTYGDLPRIEFTDSSGNVVFGTLVSLGGGIINANPNISGGLPSVNIPGLGILFDSGLSFRVQIPSVDDIAGSSFTCSVNVVYES